MMHFSSEETEGIYDFIAVGDISPTPPPPEEMYSSQKGEEKVPHTHYRTQNSQGVHTR